MSLEVPGPIHFSSELPARHQVQLEELLFFNSNQAQYRSAVIRSIEQFGEPVLRVEDGLVRVHTRTLGPVPVLYALETRMEAIRPVGVAVYARTTPDVMTVLHIGVHEEFTVTGPFAQRMLAVQLVQQIAAAAARIRDVVRVTIPYGPSDTATIALPRR